MTGFADTTVLDVALSRLNAFGRGPLVVAISDLSADDELEALARNHDAAVVRGPSDDLLARFVEVIADYPAEHLIRVHAESPYVDHRLVEQVLDSHLERDADYTSNTLLRTHPQGLEIEIIRSDALLDAAEQAERDDERSGVSTFVQRRPADYTLNAVLASGDYEDHRWRAEDSESLGRLTDLLNKSGSDLTKAWDELISYDKPISPGGDVRLRVARQNVVDRLGEFTDTIGYPPDPFPIGDAARRSYGVWRGEDLVGAVNIAVQNGWGTLSGCFAPDLPGGVAEQTLGAIDEILLADEQVLALTVDGSAIRTYRA